MKKALYVALAVSALFFLLFSHSKQKDTTSVINDAKSFIDVPVICQYPSLPTGCESVAATMVLQFYGLDITEVEFARNWLESSQAFYYKEDKLYGPDPNKVFAGDPFSEYSYGCFAEVIVNAVNNNSSMCRAEKIIGTSLNQLCKEYIDNGKPLLIWATGKMKPSKKGTVWNLPDGNEFIWTYGEHCLVLVGYNENFYFFNDPQSDKVIAYSKHLVEKRYKELGSQAVYIYSLKQ